MTTVRETAAGISAARARRLRRARTVLGRAVDLLAGEIDVDLIPIEKATAAMAARLREGEVLYDKG